MCARLPFGKAEGIATLNVFIQPKSRSELGASSESPDPDAGLGEHFVYFRDPDIHVKRMFNNHSMHRSYQSIAIVLVSADRTRGTEAARFTLPICYQISTDHHMRNLYT